MFENKYLKSAYTNTYTIKENIRNTQEKFIELLKK